MLAADNLKRHYQIGGGLFSASRTLKAVDGDSFTLAAGKTLEQITGGTHFVSEGIRNSIAVAGPLPSR